MSLTQAFPADQFSWKVLGAVLKQTGRAEESLIPMCRSLELNPDDAEAHNNVGVTLQELDRLEEAEHSFGQAISINSDYAEAHYNLARTLHSLKKLARAEASYRAAISLRPGYAEAYNNLGNMLLESENLADAEEHYRRAVALRPDYAEAHYNLGCALRDLGRLGDAEDSYRKAAEIQPSHALAHTELGNIFLAAGKLEQAKSCFEKSVSIEPHSSKRHNQLGCVLHKLGKLTEAEASFRRAVLTSSDKAQALTNLGVLLQDLGRFDQAESTYAQAIEADPCYVEAHNSLGVLLRRIGRLEKAEASYSRALEVSSDHAAALSNRSQVRFELGQFESALQDIELCNTIDSSARVLEILYALGRFDEIYERIERSAEMNDTNIRMAAFAAFISERLSRPTAHNFCPDPLSFLHFSNIAKHVEYPRDFVAELVADVRSLEATWDPWNKATVNGFQMAEHITLFDQPSSKIQSLKGIIYKELEIYRANFQGSSCSFIQKWPAEKSLVGWHVIYKRQGHQHAHIHPEGWLSGVVYLQTVPALGDDEGAIEFSLNGELFSDPSSPSFTYQPVVGDIVLFPSSLYHRTIPFSVDADRIVIAFDLLPTSVLATKL